MQGASNAQAMRIIPGIAMLARPNIRVVLSGEMEWAKNLPAVGDWGAVGALVAPDPGKSKFEAEQINATVGVAF